DYHAPSPPLFPYTTLFRSLVNGSRINIDMNFLCVRTKIRQPACNTVVKTRTNTNNEISIVHGQIGLQRAVHAQHAKKLLVVCRRSEEHTSELQSRFELVCL